MTHAGTSPGNDVAADDGFFAVAVDVGLMMRVCGGRLRWEREEGWHAMDHVKMQALISCRCIWRQWQLRKYGIELVFGLLNA